MKYRLWNKYKKCWETDCYVISRNGEVYFIDYGEICGCFPSKTHVLQRSLGLKDIHGNEVFEGDIVKIDYGDGLLMGTMEFYISHGVSNRNIKMIKIYIILSFVKTLI